jgi:carbonic anhydrase
MTLLDQILERNEEFVASRSGAISKTPKQKIALFTCMDTRLVEFLEPAMGLGRGDAKIIKNAGNTLIDPQGGVVRSLVMAIYLLGCEELFVIGHRDCGMAELDEGELRRRMLARGVPEAAIDSLQPSLREWSGAFRDPAGNVRNVAAILRKSPLIPDDVPIHGLIFDPVSGRLEVLTDGYQAR